MSPVQTELGSLRLRLLKKLEETPSGAQDLAPEIADYDALLAKYRNQPEAGAAVALERAVVSFRVLNDEGTAQAQFEALVKAYPGTTQAEIARRELTLLTPEARAERKAKIATDQAKHDALIGKPAPELDFTWSTRAGLKELGSLRGKVVVLDFWATWCGPCIASFPKVRAEVAHFAQSPVVFHGITSLQGKVHGLEPKPIDVTNQPEREYELTANFMKKHEVTWDIAFSTQNVFNEDYMVRGIPTVVIIAPDGTVRHLGLNPTVRKADIHGKITAILKEFNLPVPEVQ